MNRVLDQEPCPTLDAYRAAGGGRGLDVAGRLGPEGTVEHLDAAGLRGRGGAGFPTGAKWRAVLANASADVPTTVVVNAAEGEPGSFKDRAILRRNPYRVLEGALVGARTVGAALVVVALKSSFREEISRVDRAIAELAEAGWTGDVEVRVVEGPTEYLFGEETALLEVVDGRPPLPRIAPPFRRGLSDIGDADVNASRVELAASFPESGGRTGDAPPALVNNVETFANVTLVLADGPDAFRSLGTADSPGTVVCTVTGRTARHGVGEFPMGTTVREVIAELGDWPRGDVAAVLTGVSGPLLDAGALDTPLTWDAMAAAGPGLGTCGFVVLDDTVDAVALAHGVSRFLSVESCGQCTPCKDDGRAITDILDRLRRSEPEPDDLDALERHLETVTQEARCNLAGQHQSAVRSILGLFPETVEGHVTGRLGAAELPEAIAPIEAIDADHATVVEQQAAKQPDWTYDAVDSGKSPADRLAAADS